MCLGHLHRGKTREKRKPVADDEWLCKLVLAYASTSLHFPAPYWGSAVPESSMAKTSSLHILRQVHGCVLWQMLGSWEPAGLVVGREQLLVLTAAQPEMSIATRVNCGAVWTCSNSQALVLTISSLPISAVHQVSGA